MWYIASMVRGMTVDEAVRQLSFCPKNGATHVKETILEAQNLAVEKHNVEFRTNLWVGKCWNAAVKSNYETTQSIEIINVFVSCL